MSTRPPGTWRRFITALVALLGVAVAIPVGLVIVGRASVGTGNPLPGIGSASEIREWIGRELSTTEVMPVVLRSLLIVSWLLWLALMSSVVSAFVASRPSIGHVRVPRLAMFDGFAIWIATGLAVLSSLSPKIAIADSMTSASIVPAAVADLSAGTPSERRIEPARAGFESVETGESIEMFAERTLGNGSRWPEVWELGRGTVVDSATGATWDEPWRLEGGWQLRLPTSVAGSARPAAVGDSTATSEVRATQRRIEVGDSYWSISTDLLVNHLDREPSAVETLALVDTLIERNARRLGHVEPSMLHPGDVIDINVDLATPPTVSKEEHIVEAGDSYWSIAEATLWATTSERPAEADVFLLTEQLMVDNAERLGYEDRELIHPGDVVRLQPEASEAPSIDDVPETQPAGPEIEVEAAPTVPASGGGAGDEAEGRPTEPVVESTTDYGAGSPLPTPGIPATVVVDSRTSPLPAPRPGDSVPTGDTADDGRNVIPVGALAGLSLLSAAGIAALIRRRHTETRQSLRPGRRLAEPTPETREAMEDVLYRDVSDVTWMDHELRLLAHLLDPAARRRMTIELVQLAADRTLEVAFQQVVEVAPPGSWISVADRVWRLDSPHDDSMLAEVQDAPPIAPSLVTLGDPADGRQLFYNLESAAGINVTGDTEEVAGWLSSALWEVAGRAMGEGSAVHVVANDSFTAFTLPDGVEHVDETTVFGLIDDPSESASAEDRSILSLRTGRWESWPSTVLVLATEPSDARWDGLAAQPSVAVLSTSHQFDGGVDLQIENGVISIPSLGIKATAATITKAEQLTIDEVLQSVDVAAIEEVAIEPPPLEAAPLEHTPEIDENWELPTWPVMINVLGPPRAYKNGEPLKLTPQQVSALALIATKREIPAHDFRRSIWGDEDDVSPERVRDMLSQLRKKVGGLRVIPKREDGLVCAGDDLGSDTLVFDALIERANLVPGDRDELLRDALDLVSGRVLDYSTSDSAWWRWSEIAFGSTDWTARTTEVAVSLAQSHLEGSEPAAARDIAERGLVADPLNASLTELLMEAYADLGTLESAQRVYESHDRSLDMADLGGASPETRRVLERIRAAASQTDDKAARVS